MMSPEFEARLDRERGYKDRARRIVDRLLPALPSAHGFYQPHAFIAGARRRGDRNYLQWMIFARLRAKAEGDEPRVAIPKNCEHLWRAGDAMFDASRDCTDPAAWDRLRAYVAKERARDRAAA